MECLANCLCHHCHNVKWCHNKAPEFNFDGLSAREYKIMDLLIRNRGIIVTLDQIITKGWDIASTPSISTLRNQMWRLRKKVDVVIKCKSRLGYWIEKPSRGIQD
jgi:DNA-binding response OmpR family regulator